MTKVSMHTFCSRKKHWVTESIYIHSEDHFILIQKAILEIIILPILYVLVLKTIIILRKQLPKIINCNKI
jgi:hypothetical protein